MTNKGVSVFNSLQRRLVWILIESHTGISLVFCLFGPARVLARRILSLAVTVNDTGALSCQKGVYFVFLDRPIMLHATQMSLPVQRSGIRNPTKRTGLMNIVLCIAHSNEF